jgi:hypothetical protein
MSVIEALLFGIACLGLCVLLFWAARLLFRLLLVVILTALLIYGLYTNALLPSPLEKKVKKFLSSERVNELAKVVKSWWSETSQNPPEQVQGENTEEIK